MTLWFSKACSYTLENIPNIKNIQENATLTHSRVFEDCLTLTHFRTRAVGALVLMYSVGPDSQSGFGGVRTESDDFLFEFEYK